MSLLPAGTALVEDARALRGAARSALQRAPPHRPRGEGPALHRLGHPGHSGYTDLLISHCRAAGFEPRTDCTALRGTPPVTAVIGTDRCAFLTTPPGPAADGAVCIVALDPPLYAPLHALYSPQTTSPARDAFLTTATQ
ncbi:hypothetical protein [Streptomyces sp. NPDC003395]